MVSEVSCLEFFLCAKMDDDMIKLNSMNYSTWKHMMEDFLYCQYLYKLIRLKKKHHTYLMMIEILNIEKSLLI